MSLMTRYGVSGASAGSGQIQVDNGDALKALEVSGLPDGTLVFVRSIQAQACLKKAPLHPYAIDDITVWQPDSGGPAIWARVPGTSEIWLKRSIWEINKSTGDDENDGDQSTPLKTWAELSRRLGLQQCFYAGHIVTVITTGDFGPDDPVIGHVHIGTSGAFVVKPRLENLEVMFTGIVSAKEDLNFAIAPGKANTTTSTWVPSSLISSKVVNGEGYIVTNNAGLWAWIVKDLGGGKAKLSPWTVLVTEHTGASGELSFGNVAVGAVLTVYRLPKIKTLRWITEGGTRGAAASSFNFFNIDITPSSGRIDSLGSPPSINQCRLAGTIYAYGSIANLNSLIATGGAQTAAEGAAGITLNSGAVLGSIAVNSAQYAGTLWELRGHVLFQAAIMTATRGALLRIRNAFFEDCTDSCLQGEFGATIVVNASTVCGEGNTNAIVQLKGASRLMSGAGSLAPQFLVATSGAPIKFNSNTICSTFSPNTGAWSAYTNPLTFANIDAPLASGGFGGSVFDPISGCFAGLGPVVALEDD